ncbi:Autoinducer 2 sensor kinase/phosphatase LuxQ [BD1-7 clade bacterium]|uniref:histidine kinase n=1 Tax=BD1-7 clade bacterium TaxID=2029982 RepID=A0A5S9PHH4_9GAMM|nr:Autoinducer 2 sensor kinase/phosphatase LuxQ [BD1-7 clade bacterium]
MSSEDKGISQVEFEEHRLDTFMKESFPHYLGAVFVAAPFYAFILHKSAIENAYLIWFSFDFIFLLIITYVYYVFFKKRETLTFVTAALPIVYFSFFTAMAPWLFLKTDQSIYYFTLLVMQMALIANSSYVFSYYVKLVALLLGLPMASLLLKVSFSEIENRLILQIGILMNGISAFAFYSHVGKQLLETISLKLENIQSRIEAEQANQSKTKFLAAASHDIRQPLQAVIFFLETLKNRNREPEDDVIYQRLQSSVDNISALLNDLLDISKLDADSVNSKKEHFSLVNLCDRLLNEIHPFAKKKSLIIEQSINESHVYADEILLERVLKNLLSNAVRYTDKGTISIYAKEQSGKVLIQVKDTGIGIPENEQKSIFDEFHQLHNPERDSNNGLGLGLAIVKRLCDFQDWTLSLSSDSSGSCFSIEVPSGHQDQVVKKIQPDSTGKLEHIRALIIDDDTAICHSLVALFENWGSEVKAFDSAKAAEDFLLTHVEWRPNVLISDYRLREHKTGADAAQQIHEVLDEKIPVLIITGDTDPARIKEAKASGFTVIHKPIKPVAIRTFIRQRCKHLTH